MAEGRIMATRADDEAQILRLDSAWNEAYRRHDRSPLADILADDFAAVIPSGESVTKAALMINPSQGARSVAFSEQSALVFGDTAVSRGRLQLELDDRCVDQRFLRVFARREGLWRAVSVAVTPVGPTAT
jgi:ketosteroid isomerase-like protein